MKKLIIVSDWAKDSLTCQEVKSTIEGYLKNGLSANISFVSADSSTINTSFILSQIAETEERYGIPHETVIFENTDPRIHTETSIEKAKGADFLIGKLSSGIIVNGPNAGNNFSLIKHKIEELFFYKALNEGSQFRSRDIYARINAHLMDSLEDELDLEEMHFNVIPELKEHCVLHIDNFGNIKTSIKTSEFKGKYRFGDKLHIDINNVKKTAHFVDNLFGAIPGELVIYPGSSGQRDDPFLEVSIWRHFTEKNSITGLQAFNYPKPGSLIKLG